MIQVPNIREAVLEALSNSLDESYAPRAASTSHGAAAGPSSPRTGPGSLRRLNPSTARTVQTVKKSPPASAGPSSYPVQDSVRDWVDVGEEAPADEQPFVDRLTHPSTAPDSPRSDIHGLPADYDDKSYISAPGTERDSEVSPGESESEIRPTDVVSHSQVSVPDAEEQEEEAPTEEASEVSVEEECPALQALLESFEEEANEEGTIQRIRQWLLNLASSMMKALKHGVVNPVKGALHTAADLAQKMSKRIFSLVQEAVSWLQGCIQVMMKKVSREKWKEMCLEVTLHAVMATLIVMLTNTDHQLAEGQSLTLGSDAIFRDVASDAGNLNRMVNEGRNIDPGFDEHLGERPDFIL